MDIGIGIIFLIAAYLLGSVPFGLIIVKLRTGKDVREVQSGRTGGTNAMRAAGLWAGLLTAFLDFLKAAVAAWIAHLVLQDMVWIHVLAPVMVILGHNYSIFLIERGENGKLHFHGGAGGAPSAGGATGLWLPTILIILPIAGFILYFIGYASVATLSSPIITTIVFIILAWKGILPWEYVAYGVLAFILLAWSLRPNIRRLFNGTERVIGLRAKKAGKEKKVESPPVAENHSSM
jgi:glycerol-3-phosphate acyltransferase PlsY